MKTSFRAAGSIACLVALLGMSGGHWLALQSAAWVRMLVEFSRSDSLSIAIIKTFDGRHPCSICLKVRAGLHEQQQQEKKNPPLKIEKLPECTWQFRQLTASPLPASPTAPSTPFASAFYLDFTESPPTPPPRG